MQLLGDGFNRRIPGRLVLFHMSVALPSDCVLASGLAAEEPEVPRVRSAPGQLGARRGGRSVPASPLMDRKCRSAAL